MAEPGLLLGEQRPVPLVEVREVGVAPVGYRRGEVRPVLLFELQERGGVVGAEAFESGHASMAGRGGCPYDGSLACRRADGTADAPPRPRPRRRRVRSRGARNGRAAAAGADAGPASRGLLPLRDAVPPIRGLRGRPRRKPRRMYADRGYDFDKYRRMLWKRGIKPMIARRGVVHGSGLGKVRWVVERAFAWLHQFKRLRTRYEQRVDLHHVLLELACPSHAPPPAEPHSETISKGPVPHGVHERCGGARTRGADPGNRSAGSRPCSASPSWTWPS